jgi:hypothetical protein
LHEASVTTTRFAPASKAIFTTVATTSGFVLAAWIGMRSQPMFGFTTTMSPREMKRFIPPKASTARRVSTAVSGSCFAITNSGNSSPVALFSRKSRT